MDSFKRLEFEPSKQIRVLQNKPRELLARRKIYHAHFSSEGKLWFCSKPPNHNKYPSYVAFKPEGHFMNMTADVSACLKKPPVTMVKR